MAVLHVAADAQLAPQVGHRVERVAFRGTVVDRERGRLDGRPQGGNAALYRRQFEPVSLGLVGQAGHGDTRGVFPLCQEASGVLGLRRQFVEFEQERDRLVLAGLEFAFDRGDFVLHGLVLAAVGHRHQLLPELREPLLGGGDVAVTGAALRLPLVDGLEEGLEVPSGLEDRRLDGEASLVDGVDTGAQGGRLPFEVLQVVELLEAGVHRGTVSPTNAERRTPNACLAEATGEGGRRRATMDPCRTTASLPIGWWMSW